MKLEFVYDDDGHVDEVVLDEKAYTIDKSSDNKYIVLYDGIIRHVNVAKINDGYIITDTLDDGPTLYNGYGVYIVIDADVVFDKLENATYYSCGLMGSHGLNNERL